jgi:archaellum component FlaC
MSLPERRGWEFKSFTICRVLGLTFDEEELRRVFVKLGFKADRQLSPAEMHGALVHTCTTPGLTSKHMDKMLREYFEPYRKRVEGLDQEDICRLIEGEDGFKDIPLSALLWFVARNEHGQIDQIEARAFNAIHMKEHRALRFYDELSRTLPHGQPENVLGELSGALKSKQEFQNRCTKLEQRKEQLRSELEVVKQGRSTLAMGLEEQRHLNARLKKELEGLADEATVDQIESLKREKELLTEGVKALTEELLRRDQLYGAELGDSVVRPKVKLEDKSVTFDQMEVQSPEPMQGSKSSLKGRTVAFIGGLESLIPCYKQMVESLGGVFCYHCGKCSQGKKEIEGLVDKADVVFCPVDINSHYACRCAKKACKLKNRPCYFMRSSGLISFRRRLVDFAGSN